MHEGEPRHIFLGFKLNSRYFEQGIMCCHTIQKVSLDIKQFNFKF